jgi:hypothetical protein
MSRLRIALMAICHDQLLRETDWILSLTRFVSDSQRLQGSCPASLARMSAQRGAYGKICTQQLQNVRSMMRAQRAPNRADVA